MKQKINDAEISVFEKSHKIGKFLFGLMQKKNDTNNQFQEQRRINTTKLQILKR